MNHALQGKRSRNQVPAVDYFYSAAERRSRGALWPSFALALIVENGFEGKVKRVEIRGIGSSASNRLF